MIGLKFALLLVAGIANSNAELNYPFWPDIVDGISRYFNGIVAEREDVANEIGTTSPTESEKISQVGVKNTTGNDN